MKLQKTRAKAKVDIFWGSLECHGMQPVLGSLQGRTCNATSHLHQTNFVQVYDVCRRVVNEQKMSHQYTPETASHYVRSFEKWSLSHCFSLCFPTSSIFKALKAATCSKPRPLQSQRVVNCEFMAPSGSRSGPRWRTKRSSKICGRFS